MVELSHGAAIQAVILPMEYRAVMTGGAALARPQEAAPSSPSVQELEARIRELQGELEERSRNFTADIEAARSEAREEGKAGERSERASRVEAALRQLSSALDGFAAERDRYLKQVEQEVVRLALAIAARILHREAQMDPLLLAGAVRVALGQLADTTEIRLIVPAQEQELWREMLRLMPNLPARPEVVGEGTLAAGDCRIEAKVGNIDLGVRSQLAEIERGFFDLLEKREESALRAREPEGKGGGVQQDIIDGLAG